eukprot:TRINITY_DN12146_c0_g5_i1.p1 TRINITY_DN12146_c0_g5~~TRINITY_DN12146_c0_g5_i1.p1  ORF type:complete len:529 (-),score=134.39 TRINITY_DN12146_c0_g5_i1:84-1670(-)
MEENTCEFCEANAISVKCLDCAKLTFLCKACYAQSHKSDAKRKHRVEPVTTESFIMQLQQQKNKELGKMCAEHGEVKKYVCQKCNKSVCSSCLLIGTHKGHESVLLEEGRKIIRSKYEDEFKEYTKVAEDIKSEILTASDKQQRMAKEIYEQKDLIDRIVEGSITLIKAKRESLIELLDSKNIGVEASIKKVSDLLGITENCMGQVKEILNETEQGISPERFDALIECSMQKPAELKTFLAKLKLSANPELDIEHKLSFTLEDFAQFVEKHFAFEETYKCSISSFKNAKVSNRLYQKRAYQGVAIDCATNKLYVINGINGETILTVYDSTEDLFKRKQSGTIKLDVNHNGTYFAVLNGMVYYIVEDSIEIIKVDLKNTKPTGRLLIENASKNNGGGQFFWGGRSDIAILADSIENKVYIIYQDIHANQCKIAELKEETNGMVLGETWVLPEKKKQDFWFAFVGMGHLYLGSAFSKSVIDCDYNLKKSQWEPAPDIKIEASYIVHVTLISSQDLIVSDYNNGILSISPK